MGILDSNIMTDIFEEFDKEFNKSLRLYLTSHDFFENSKEIDRGINSYHIEFKKYNIFGSDKYVSFNFCMHHLDLFDGIYVNLYTERQRASDKIKLSLNNAIENFINRKIYSQLKMGDAVEQIESDLKSKAQNYIETKDLSEFEYLLSQYETFIKNAH